LVNALTQHTLATRLEQ